MNAMGIREYDCSEEITLGLIGGKWKVMILWEPMQAPVLRCRELRSRIPGGSVNYLSHICRRLKRDALVWLS
jgi:DNA-binding HxlR family transcriptional regulator